MEANSFFGRRSKSFRKKMCQKQKEGGVGWFFLVFFGTPRFKTSSPATLKKKKEVANLIAVAPFYTDCIYI